MEGFDNLSDETLFDINLDADDKEEKTRFNWKILPLAISE